MEIKVTMLGTSGSSPARGRNMPSVAITYDGHILLLDCGEGTQMQMLKYGVNSARVEAIFISHAHGDHIIGVAGLVRSMAMNGRQKPLDIFVPKGAEATVKTLLMFDKAIIDYKIDVKGVAPGMVYKGRNFSVKAFRIDHTVTTYGYVFKEDDRRRFIVDKCKKLGIKGEMFSTLEKKGKLMIGKKLVRLNDVTVPQNGKSVVYASDTRPVPATASAARGAELLIHESSYADSEAALAKERKHSTAGEAAKIAKKAGVKALVLTHISARYANTDAIQNDAKKVFRNSRAAVDGEVIIV